MCRSYLTLFVVGALWSLGPSTKGEELTVPSEETATAISKTAANSGILATPEQEVEQQIRDLESQVNAAVLSGDLRVFERLLAEDFTHTNQTGVFRTRVQWLANHKPGQSPYTRYDVDELKIRVYGDTAVVTARTTPQGQDSKGKPITGQYRYLRVWAKRDGKWQAVAFQGTRISP
jgi:ketosteroid isomerase-like protein